MIGAALLWVGWVGVNAGSTLEANGGAGLAMVNTFLATAAHAAFLRPTVEVLLVRPEGVGHLDDVRLLVGQQQGVLAHE